MVTCSSDDLARPRVVWLLFVSAFLIASAGCALPGRPAPSARTRVESPPIGSHPIGEPISPDAMLSDGMAISNESSESSVPAMTVASLAPGPDVESPASSPALDTLATPPASILSGSWSLRYRGRFTDSDQDHDLRGLLALDLDDPKAPWFSAHLVARADADLDGPDDGPVFHEISDTYDTSVTGKLALAYADLALGERPGDSPGTLRIGRQSDPRLPEVLRLDGVAYTSGPRGAKELELGLYGGVPVHFYESSSGGDQAYGVFLEWRPWVGARSRVDWMHLEDERTLGTERDDLFALSLWQRLARSWRLEGELTRLEGRARDLRLRAIHEDPDSPWILRLGYHELLETQRAQALELDPFSEALQELFPYRQATLNLARDVGRHLRADIGLDVRRVDDVGEFNRDWERIYTTLTLEDLGLEGLALSVTGDRWTDEQRDIGSVGADLSFQGDGWSGALGSEFALYKYEFLELDEREEVRTTYLRCSRQFSKNLRVELGYALEDDDLDTYNTLRWSTRWRF